MPKFSIPIVIQIKADSVEDAEVFAERFMRHGFESIYNHEPATRKAIKYVSFAEIQIRARKPV